MCIKITSILENSFKFSIFLVEGITNKLEHFVECGVDGVWLSPIFTSPMKDFGYDISDYRDVAQVYGSLADLENLINRAKELGLRVILDLVPNHTSNQHYWFRQSVQKKGKYKDYYIWKKGRNNNLSPPNNWLSQFSNSAWTYNSRRDEWYYHEFGFFQPDLNYSNPYVREEIEVIIHS